METPETHTSGNTIVFLLLFVGIPVVCFLAWTLNDLPEVGDDMRIKSGIASEQYFKDQEAKRATASAREEKRSSIPQQGMTYSVVRTYAGPRRLADRSEVDNAIAYDRQGLVEMMMAGRAAMVNPGETVRVVNVDASFMNGVWVEVRVVSGQASGKLWLPSDVLGM